MLPAIGSLTAAGGRLGVVVDVRPPAEAADGRQLAALQLRTVDQRDAQGQAAARVSALAPLPAEATERPGASRRTLAPRDERAAAVVARLPERMSGPADPAGSIQEVYQQGPDDRRNAVGGSVDIRVAAPSGAAVELQRLDGRLAVDPSARDYAVAHFGYRLYAETQSNQAQGAELQSSPPDSDPDQIRTRGGRVDLTS
jgi:hypothetical protein